MVFSTIISNGYLILCNATARESLITAENVPWAINEGQEFTWNITASPSPFEVNRLIKFIVDDMSPATNIGEDPDTWLLLGNLSEYTDMATPGEFAWLDLMTESIFYKFNPLDLDYEIMQCAFNHKIYIIPVNYEHSFTAMEWFRLGMSRYINSSLWNVTINENELSYQAINKTNSLDKISIIFNDKGVMKEYTRTDRNGDIESQLVLIQEYDPSSDQSFYYIVIGLFVIGGLITIAMIIIYKKYKIRMDDSNPDESRMIKNEENNQ
ncbi:MAG: hypothetical protein ACTSWN_02165 [Promethearchaeota archaeon]